MELISNINTEFWAVSILVTGSLFLVFWMLDNFQHKKMVKVDLTGRELQTHRNIIATTVFMQISLLLMFWFPLEALPFFLAFFLTRTAHEFMDELKWHMDRCTPYETTLHLAMWVTILSNTFLMFMWGFFTQYEGLLELHPVYFVWAGVIFIMVVIIGVREWKLK